MQGAVQRNVSSVLTVFRVRTMRPMHPATIATTPATASAHPVPLTVPRSCSKVGPAAPTTTPPATISTPTVTTSQRAASLERAQDEQQAETELDDAHQGALVEGAGADDRLVEGTVDGSACGSDRTDDREC